MNRNLVFGTLAICVCGLLAVGCAALPSQRRPGHPGLSGPLIERRAWASLWWPLIPASVFLTALLGWAAQEPYTTDEPLRSWTFVVAVAPGLILFRAGLRAVLSLRRSPTGVPAVTVGLLRPKIIVTQDLRATLDASAFAAAYAHEEAHALHRDPLRLWIASIAADLQWPSPGAARRLRSWRSALELARDEEARRRGVLGEDLAAAILGAARMSGSGGAIAGPVAHLTSSELDISARIHRLLSPLSDHPPRSPRLARMLILVGLVLASLVGRCFGDPIVRALPFVAT